MRIITTDKAPAAVGPYSQAVVVGDLVYTSGQIPLDPATNVIIGPDIESQTEQVCKNLQALLYAAGSDLAHVIKTSCYLADMNDFPAFNAVYGSYFVNKPARACVAVKALPKGVLLEVDCVAELR